MISFDKLHNTSFFKESIKDSTNYSKSLIARSNNTP